MSNLPQKILWNGDLPAINTGQEALFLLICKKLKQKEIIKYEEAKEIYINCVQRYEAVSLGYYDNETGKWIERSRTYYDYEIETLFQSWLLRALGALIKKGYLAVIPRIEFSKTKILAERKE